MEPVKKPRGRPRKPDTEGTAQQVKKRQYMRKYVGEIKAGITQLEQDEADCLKHLDNIRKERTKLIDMIDSANRQATSILNNTLKPPVKMSKPSSISMSRPKPRKIIKKVMSPESDVIFDYLKDEGTKTLQASVRRKLAKK